MRDACLWPGVANSRAVRMRRGLELRAEGLGPGVAKARAARMRKILE